jgi:hypothetical protein
MLCLRNNTAVSRVVTRESAKKAMAGERSSGFWEGELSVGKRLSCKNKDNPLQSPFDKGE